MKLVLLWLICFAGLIVRAQHPDRIQISFKDTIRNYQEATLEITLAKKDSGLFLFPSNFTIGEDDGLSDLMLVIQKLDKNNNYTYYRCKQGSFGVPPHQRPPLVLTPYRIITFIDSLDDLGCITRGHFRIQIVFNQRRQDGKLSESNILAASNWVHFYVDADEVVLSSYARMRLEEEKAKGRKLKNSIGENLRQRLFPCPGK
jgi:hypothetical protein